jgi:hypothetical protein
MFQNVNVVHSGWAHKQGSHFKTWKKRYFVLLGRDLVYFTKQGENGMGQDEKGRVHVVGAEFAPDLENGLLVHGDKNGQVMRICTSNRAEKQIWFDQLNAICDSCGGCAQSSGCNLMNEEATMKGWLQKEGQNFKTWKRRYMVLAGKTITYYSNFSYAPLGKAVIHDVKINYDKPFSLDLYSESNRVLRISADSLFEIQAWSRAICTAIKKPDCYGNHQQTQQQQHDAYFGSKPCNDMIHDYKGWLYKRGRHSTAWKKRFFILKDNILEYRQNSFTDVKGSGRVQYVCFDNAESNCLEIFLDTGRFLKVSADSKDDLVNWYYQLCHVAGNVASSNPFESNTNQLSGSTSSSVSQSSHNSHMSLTESDDQDASPGRKAGWLRKEGNYVKNWKRRYFILEENILYYYEQINEAPKGSGIVTKVEINTSHSFCLNVTLANGRVLRILATNQPEIDSWYEHLVNQASSSLVQSNNKNSDLEGWLTKKGQHFKTWKRRYFVLKGSKLAYSKKVGDIPLGSGQIFDVCLGDVRHFCLDIRFRNGRMLHIVAANDDELNTWMSNLENAANFTRNGGTPLLIKPGVGTPNAAVTNLKFDNDFDYDDDGEEDYDSAIEFDDDFDECKTSDLLLQNAQNKNSNSWFDILDRAKPKRKDSVDSFGSLDSDEEEQDIFMDHEATSNHLSSPFIVIHHGWLEKEGKHRKNWKKRYFTLRGTKLCYFKGAKGKRLRSCTIMSVNTSLTNPKGINITLESGRKLSVLAPTNDEADAWFTSMKNALMHGPVQNEVPAAPIATGDAQTIEKTVLTHIEESRSYSGWLEKEGKHFKTWKRRFFTVKNKNLIYYKDDKKSEAQGHGTITSVLVYTGKPFSLEIVLNNDRIMRVSGGHQEEMDRWYHAISTGLGIFNEKPSEVLSDNRCSCSSES